MCTSENDQDEALRILKKRYIGQKEFLVYFDQPTKFLVSGGLYDTWICQARHVVRLSIRLKTGALEIDSYHQSGGSIYFCSIEPSRYPKDGFLRVGGCYARHSWKKILAAIKANNVSVNMNVVSVLF